MAVKVAPASLPVLVERPRLFDLLDQGAAGPA
jgi:hypothetical protein